MRFAAFSPIALSSTLMLAGCAAGATFTLPGAPGVTPDDYPVRKASCVDAVRRANGTVDVRAETAEVTGGDDPETLAVVFGLVVGPEAAPWTCTADNAGAVSNVGRVAVPEPEAVSPETDEAAAAEG